MWRETDQKLWIGRRGIALFALALCIAAGISWIGWVGAPKLPFDTNGYIVTRAQKHQREVMALVWWISLLITSATMFCVWGFVLTAAVFASLPITLASGKNYKIATLTVLGGGMLSALIGGALSYYAR